MERMSTLYDRYRLGLTLNETLGWQMGHSGEIDAWHDRSLSSELLDGCSKMCGLKR